VNSWDWSFGDGDSDQVKNPVHSYSNPGTYTITLVANNQYGCPDSIKKVVALVGFNPIATSGGGYICAGGSIQLHASGGISYTWSPAAGLDDPNSPNPIASPTATTHYTVAITMISGSDTCVAIKHSNTTVSIATYSASVLTAFAHPDTLYPGQSTQLGTYAPGGTVVWNPPYNISNVNSNNPTAWPGHTTTYSAIYTDGHGCSFPIAAVTVYVIVKECDDKAVFVPNTFTPNNDGVNDVMYARSNLVEDIHFVIADRWGQIVFETYDITKGWDGVFKGLPCNPDVFGYYITYTCNNGKKSFKKGNITLIR
ncbi:MAG: T9SS type B sorting domain-containing protein, partial [Bacteroidia bacterium]